MGLHLYESWHLPCVLLATTMIGYKMDTGGDLQDYCEKDTFNAKCPDGEVVLIEEARYGRMALGTCIKHDYGTLNCFSDVQQQMDTLCSGLQSCRIAVHHSVGIIDPCSSELRSYLQARYTCIPVADPGKQCCQGSEKHVYLNAMHGHIASSVSRATGCGNLDCPWHLVAPNGQQLNISLYDFAVSDERNTTHVDGRRMSHSNRCIVYAVIKEDSAGITQTICGGNSRMQHVYTTSSNSLEIRIVQEGNTPNFVIGYEVFGCPDPSPPAHGFIKRNKDRVEIYCRMSDNKWEIICQEGKWKGHHGNCTAVIPVEAGVGEIQVRSGLHYVTPSIVMALIIALAIIMAVAIVTIGIVCTKRRSNQRNTLAVTYSVQTSERYSKKGIVMSMGKNATINRGTLLPPDASASQSSDIPWYLKRPLPQPEVQYDVGYFMDSGYESPQRHEHLPNRRSIKYYELDPEAGAFSQDIQSDNNKCGEYVNHSTLPKRAQRPSLPIGSDRSLVPGGKRLHTP